MNSPLTSVRVIQWTEEQFFSNKETWNNLLQQSEADPIYCSWEWAVNWWKQYRKETDTLAITVLLRAEEVLAIAPLFMEQDSYVRGFFKTTRLQYLGKRFSEENGIRSEYMGIIGHKNLSHTELHFLFNHIIRNIRWSEISLADEDSARYSYTELKNVLLNNGYYRRIDSTGETYAINCQSQFSSYLAALGKNTRLKLYNRRKLLGTLGEIDLEFINNGNKNQFYDQLNQWYQTRWGINILGKDNITFIENVFNTDTSRLSLKYSCMLKLDGKPLSVMINLSDNDKVYNLLLAYEENFNKKIALGTLHLGYLIEHLFETPQIRLFDLLEGQGKHSNYKAKFAQKRSELVSSRCFRTLSLKYLFKFYDRFIRK